MSRIVRKVPSLEVAKLLGRALYVEGEDYALRFRGGIWWERPTTLTRSGCKYDPGTVWFTPEDADEIDSFLSWSFMNHPEYVRWKTPMKVED